MFYYIVYNCFSLAELGSKAIRELRGTTNQRVMKGKNLSLSLCTESEVIVLKKMDFIGCFTLDGGFSC